MRVKIIILMGLFLITSFSNAQVAVGNLQPNESAQMDIISSNKGLLIPRIALTNVNDATTIKNGNIESLLVYNTTSNESISAGYYYWFNKKWVRLTTDLDLVDLKNTTNVSMNVNEGKLIVQDSDSNSVSILLSEINAADIVTTLTKNANHTYTYSNEASVEVVIDPTQVKVSFADGIYTFTDALGTVLAEINANADHLVFNNNSNNNGLAATDIQAAIEELLVLINQSQSNITAENGLTKTDERLTLGGILLKPTQIATTAENTVAFSGLQSGSITDLLVVADPATGVLKQVKQIQEKVSVPKYFYPPAVYLPTHTANANGESQIITSPQSINIYADYYLPQFGWTGNATNRAKSPSATTLPVVDANNLEYFITWFDDTVFTNVAIDEKGVLNYSIRPDAVVTAKTFMNIIFKLKD